MNPLRLFLFALAAIALAFNCRCNGLCTIESTKEEDHGDLCVESISAPPSTSLLRSSRSLTVTDGLSVVVIPRGSRQRSASVGSARSALPSRTFRFTARSRRRTDHKTPTMDGRQYFLLRLGFLSSMFLIAFVYHQKDWLLKQQEEKRHQLQEARKRLIREVCDHDNEALSNRTNRVEALSHDQLKHLIVDDKHGIIYCFIPKVACTNWKRVMYVLKQGEPYPDPASISPDLVHTSFKFTLLNSFPRTEMKARLKHYTKFLFVRDPFVRVVSAYRDKFLKDNDYFHQNFGKKILHLYGSRPGSRGAADASGGRPSFYNFVQYLVDPQTEREAPLEPHWRQMHRLCHPCLIQYDFVGRQETLREDAEQLLRILKLEDDILFPPSYQNMTSPISLAKWYGEVPVDARRRLYGLYQKDFKLFGYEKPHAVVDG